MLTNAPLFAGFAVDDIPAATAFYGDTLGVRVVEIGDGLLSIQAVNGYSVLAYVKPGHVPAAHTILNFPVDDIEATVDRLEHGELSLEEALRQFERGVALARDCQAALKQAEQKVEILLQKSATAEPQPFEPDET